MAKVKKVSRIRKHKVKDEQKKNQTLDQIKPIKEDTKPKRESNLKRVDFNHPERTEQTYLHSCKIMGQEIVLKRKTWVDLLIAITELFIAQKNPKLTSLDNMSLSGKNIFFMQRKPQKLRTIQLSNKKWLDVQHTPSAIVKIVGKLCLHCGVDLKDVHITYDEPDVYRGKRKLINRNTRGPIMYRGRRRLIPNPRNTSENPIGEDIKGERMDNLRIVDFKYPEEVLQTKLNSCTINGQEIGVKEQSWSDLLIAITEWFIAQNNPQLASLDSMPFYRNKLFYLPDDHRTHSLHQLSNGKRIRIDYTPSVLVKIIGNLCQHCGVDLANVVITYEIDEYLKPTKVKNQASPKPRGVDLMGNTVYHKEEKKQTKRHKTEKPTKPAKEVSVVDSEHKMSIVDFNHPEETEQAFPLSCKIKGQEIGLKRQSWSNLLVELTNWFISQNNAQIKTLESSPLYGQKVFFMQEKHKTMPSQQVSNGLWIMNNYTPPALIKVVKKLCLYCGVALDDVVITYTEKTGHKKERKPVKPAKVDKVKDRVNNTKIVDFNHPEKAEQTGPVFCKIKGQEIGIKKNSWSSLLVEITEWFIAKGNPQIATLDSQPLFGSKVFFMNEENKDRRTHQLTNGKWILIYQPTPTIVRIIGLLCVRCGVDLADVVITCEDSKELKNRRKAGNPDAMALDGIKGRKRTPKPVKPAIVETPKTTRFQPVLDILCLDYADGFRFDYSYVHSLSKKANMQLDDKQTAHLKKLLYQRGDNYYFLPDAVADTETRKKMAEYSSELLKKYGYFELSVLYSKFASSLNLKCVRNLEDFQTFYTQKINPDAHIVAVPKTGEQIVCKSKENVPIIFEKVAQSITSAILTEESGTISEDSLQKKFPAFSKELLGHIIASIKGNPLQRCIVNSKVYYKSQAKNSLPADFSDILAKTLYTFDQLGLPASEEALHTALSQALGVNFKGHFGIARQKHYKRIITTSYKADPPRKWKNGVFEKMGK